MKDQTTLNYEKRIEINRKRQEQLTADLRAAVQEGKKLDRDLRTHRLCNVGGLLESYLKDPAVLDQDDVKRILDGIFSNDKVQASLDRLLLEKATQGKSVKSPEKPIPDSDPGK